MGGGGSAKTPPSQTTTTQKVELPQFQSEALRRLFGNAQSFFFEEGGVPAFHGNLLAPQSTATQQGINALPHAARLQANNLGEVRDIFNTLKGGIAKPEVLPFVQQQLSQNVFDGIHGTEAGQGLIHALREQSRARVSPDTAINSQLLGSLQQGLSPGGTSSETFAAIQDAQNLINRNLTENIFASIEDQAIGSGQLGGSRQGVAQGIAARGALEEASRVANQFLLNDLDRQQRERFNSQSGLANFVAQDINAQATTNQLQQNALAGLSGILGQEIGAEQNTLNALLQSSGVETGIDLANLEALQAAAGGLTGLAGTENLVVEALLKQGALQEGRTQQELSAAAEFALRPQTARLNNLLSAAALFNQNVGTTQTTLATNPAAFSPQQASNPLLGALGGALIFDANGAAPGVGLPQCDAPIFFCGC